MTLEKLVSWFKNKKNAMVALSGGVDSALVAFAAYQSLGSYSLAVTADYKTLSQDELESAKRICSEIGIKHLIIEYNELENSDFIKNDRSRCYHCRTELAYHLKKIAKKEGFQLIVDGTNLDDLVDYRPGLIAIRENEIKNPLVETGFTKEMVRYYAKNVGLSVFDRPSNSCLASRIPWGQSITKDSLTRIESGEDKIKKMFGIKQVRLRDIKGNARIEVLPEEIKLLSDTDKFTRLELELKNLGFQTIFVDPEGYKRGKLNVIVD